MSQNLQQALNQQRLASLRRELKSALEHRDEVAAEAIQAEINRLEHRRAA